MATAVFLALLLASGGCEAIVGGSIPSVIVCVPAAYNSECPSGWECINGVCTSCANGACVTPPLDSGVEATQDVTVMTEGDAPVPPTEAAGEEPPPDVVPVLQPLGARCAGGTECKSGVCGDTLVLGADVIQKTPNMTAVCTKPCCTSADCNDGDTQGFVCHGTGTGGSFCVNPAWVGRMTPGAALPGAACSAGTGCRSGLCTGSKCQDTCCHPTDCTNGTSCTLGALDGAHTVFNCAPTSPSSASFPCNSAINGADGDYCASSNNCQSALCGNLGNVCGNCVGSCCKNSDCPGLQGGPPNTAYCMWTQWTMPNTIVLSCSTSTTPTGGPIGSPCTMDSQCAGGWCDTDPGVGKCTQGCCLDTDCRATVDWSCRPKAVTLMAGGTVTVLLCQP